MQASFNAPPAINSVRLISINDDYLSERGYGRKGRRGDDDEETSAPPAGPAATLFDFLQPKLGKGNTRIRGCFLKLNLNWQHFKMIR